MQKVFNIEDDPLLKMKKGTGTVSIGSRVINVKDEFKGIPNGTGFVKRVGKGWEKYLLDKKKKRSKKLMAPGK